MGRPLLTDGNKNGIGDSLSPRVLLALIVSLLICLTLFTSIEYSSAQSISTSSSLVVTSLPYFRVGAFAVYTAIGGSIPFFQGVSGNFSYLVTQVFPNGTMYIKYSANVTGGSESEIQPAFFTQNLTDSALDPKFFPAEPLEVLDSHSPIVLDNSTCTFLKAAQITVPAGTFNTIEFQGKDSNGTTVSYWFDTSSGLAVQGSEGVSAFQLEYSNIASPVALKSSLSSFLPAIAVFVAGWVAAGMLFFGIRRHYLRAGQKLAESRRHTGEDRTKETQGKKQSDKQN